MMVNVKGTFIVLAICAARSSAADVDTSVDSIDALFNNIAEDNGDLSFTKALDKEDFHEKVGVPYDDWVQQAAAMAQTDLDALFDVEDTLATGHEWVKKTVKKTKKAAKKAAKKAITTAKKAVVDPTAKGIKQGVDAVESVVNKGIAYFKDLATKWAKNMLNKVTKAAQWTPKEYWAFMTRIPKDFTGTQIDTNDDYSAFLKHADSATQSMLSSAFGAMKHQDKCDPKRGNWVEFHPTPFAEIAKFPNSPFSVEPFKSQYANDPTGYLLEPCNAISNGFFLSVFDHADLMSTGNCGSVAAEEMLATPNGARRDGRELVEAQLDHEVAGDEDGDADLFSEGVGGSGSAPDQAEDLDVSGGRRRRRRRRRQLATPAPTSAPTPAPTASPAYSAAYAMDCINEDHLLQVVTAAMPFGSWYMHGSGGLPLGTYLDVRGMDVQFYFMYRMALKAFVPSVEARKKLTLAHACNSKYVPDSSDGISWVDANGERNCHLYWARQSKKMLVNSTLVHDAENTAHAEVMLEGVPDMAESIAAMVFVTVRAVFHKNFPFGQELFEALSGALISALMSGAKKEVQDAQKQFAADLSADEVLGFEDPHDGITSVLEIFADFMDAMFWQESGKFGPGAHVLTKKNRYFDGISATAGCTIMPHSMWHRKATRVILGFVKMGKSLGSKLKKPSKMKLFYMDGTKPKGLYPQLIGGVPGMFEQLLAVYNMQTLAGWDFSKKDDILDPKGLVALLVKQFGSGWPETGDFATDSWPKCTCQRDNNTVACPAV